MCPKCEIWIGPYRPELYHAGVSKLDVSLSMLIGTQTLSAPTPHTPTQQHVPELPLLPRQRDWELLDSSKQQRRTATSSAARCGARPADAHVSCQSSPPQLSVSVGQDDGRMATEGQRLEMRRCARFLKLEYDADACARGAAASPGQVLLSSCSYLPISRSPSEDSGMVPRRATERPGGAGGVLGHARSRSATSFTSFL